MCVSRKASFNFTWFLAWFSLVPKSVKSTKSYYTQHFGLVPALVQPGSDKVHVNKIILYAILGLGSCLGSPWFRRGPFGLLPALVRPGSDKVHVNILGLGSCLGSAWFWEAPHQQQRALRNALAWFRPWFSLVPTRSTSTKSYYMQYLGLVPALGRVVPWFGASTKQWQLTCPMRGDAVCLELARGWRADGEHVSAPKLFLHTLCTPAAQSRMLDTLLPSRRALLLQPCLHSASQRVQIGGSLAKLAAWRHGPRQLSGQPCGSMKQGIWA